MINQNIMITSFRKYYLYSKIRYSIKGRHSTETKESKLVPGPGAYTPYLESVIKRNPQFKMPKASRSDVNETRLS